MERTRDDRLLELFDFLDRYQELQKICFGDLANAYFDLAQARYIMGTRKLSPLNFDQRMKAVAKVVPEGEGDEKPKDVDDLLESFSRLSLKRIPTGTAGRKAQESAEGTNGTEGRDSKGETLIASEEPLEASTVRRRKPRTATEDADDEVEAGVEETEESVDLRKTDNGKSKSEPAQAAGDKNDSKSSFSGEDGLRDPLRWFGVLVPPPLRSAQGKFQKATENIVGLANLKHELMALQDAFEEEEEEDAARKAKQALAVEAKKEEVADSKDDE